jgi:hypothetical protein
MKTTSDKQAPAELLAALVEIAIAHGRRHYSESGEPLATTLAVLEVLAAGGLRDGREAKDPLNVAEPADTTIIEFIKTAGGIAGLASAAFLIWDRLVRGRPRAELSATIRTSGTPADPCIRIVNPGPTGLLIRSVRVLPAGIYAVAKKSRY